MRAPDYPALTMGADSNGPGRDPDPRFTFANERTFLAWNRTALALIGSGLAAAQFLRFERGGLRLLVAVPLIVLGAGVAVSSLRRWEASERAMRLDEPLPTSTLPRPLTVGIGLIAIVCALLVVFDQVGV